MTRTAHEVQRDFAQSSGLGSEIIWDSLAADQADILKQKIANIICEKESKNPIVVEKQRQQLFENVWQQRKYTNRTLLSAIIYVLVTAESDPELALKSTIYSCHPVFRTRKCMKSGNSEGCCMIFVDEQGRVYADWSKYVCDNTLPEGLMIAPSRGVYTFSEDVNLMLQATPASQVKWKLLSAGDTFATVGALVASVPVAAALAVPVAAPLLTAATAVGAATAAYCTLRSVSRLADRRRHGQSTSIGDSEARSSWLGVAGGVLGLGASGATRALSSLAARGRRIHTAARLAVKGINVTSIVLSGGGVVSDVYDLYLKISDEQPLTSFDILQIASSLVIFTHSINNLRIASKATNGSTLRRALRNQTRKVFEEIARESVKLQGGGNSKFDIVRTLNDIPFKDALLSLDKINSHLTSVLGTLGAGLLPNIVSTGIGGYLHLNRELLATQFGSKFVQHISNEGSFMDVLDALSKYFAEPAVQLLMAMTRSFVEQHVDNIDLALKTFVSTESVLYRMLMHCVHNYEDLSAEFLERRREEILAAIRQYFKSLQSVNTENCRKMKCAVCKGAYYTCDL